MDPDHRSIRPHSLQENPLQNPIVWFPSQKLPPFADLLCHHPYNSSDPTHLRLPLIGEDSLKEPDMDSPIRKHRGAPIKEKNYLAIKYKLKNTQGHPFKFSFIAQILVAHLQHLFCLKGKSRYNRSKWLRFHKHEGLALYAQIRNMVGDDTEIMKFQRSVSCKDLKKWLNASLHGQIQGFTRELISVLRKAVFRRFCVLKCIDLRELYTLDFNVKEEGKNGWEIFYRYITQTIWEEMNMERISEEEIETTINSAVNSCV